MKLQRDDLNIIVILAILVAILVICWFYPDNPLEQIDFSEREHCLKVHGREC